MTMRDTDPMRTPSPKIEGRHFQPDPGPSPEMLGIKEELDRMRGGPLDHSVENRLRVLELMVKALLLNHPEMLSFLSGDER